MGPSRGGAKLGGSKGSAKAFIQRRHILIARYHTSTDETLSGGLRFSEALEAPCMLKTDGLRAGKGVLILPMLAETQ